MAVAKDVPAAQFAQLVWPEVAKVPATHDAHPVVATYWPAGQATQEPEVWDPRDDAAPEGQLRQVDEPGVDWYVLAAHTVHSVALAAEYLPAAQVVAHEAPAFPAAHAVHNVAPEVATDPHPVQLVDPELPWNFPAEHRVQLVVDEPCE